MLLDHGVNVDTENDQGETPLHVLSRGEFDTQQGVQTARLLLEHGADVNARRKDGCTSLHLASFEGRVEVAQLILEHGANPKLESEGGDTALHLVSLSDFDIQEQDVSIARLLLERGVDVNARDKDGFTSLHYAAFKGRVGVTQVFLDHGANAMLETERSETALHTVSRGDYNSQEQGASIARLLLERGVDVNAREKKDCWSSLHEAAMRGRVEVVRVLLDHGANAKLETKQGETALHIVSRGKYSSEEQGASIVRLLLDRGVDVNARDEDGWTSLHEAAFKGRAEVARVLLDHGANAKLETEKGETALHIVSQGDYDSQEEGASTAQLLLERGEEVNSRDKNGWTSLHWAVFKGRTEVAQVLLAHIADARLETKDGETALHLVSRVKYDTEEHGVGMARLLLEHGVDVNARRTDSWTSVHWAAYKGRVEVVQVLLDHGANAKLATKDGETALHIVSRGEYDSQEQGASTARLLMERGVDVNARQKDDWMALHWAAYKGRVEVVRALLDHGPNAKLETKDGEMALVRAMSREDQDASTARVLLECGVDVNARVKDNWTSLHWAAYKGNVEVVRALLDHGANAKLETEGGEMALHIVSRGEYDSQEQGASTARLLLEHGADVNARRKDSWTSLHWAAFKGRVEVVRALLNHGANATLENKDGETALHLVSRSECNSKEQGASTARLLLERGVDVNAVQKDGWTALHWASYKGGVEVVRALLDHDLNVKLGTKDGEMALRVMSREDQGASTARVLLECDVDVNARVKDNWTSLHWAAFQGKVEVVRALLDHGANAKLETKGGETALHLVARGKYDSEEHGVGVAQLLLEQGVDVHVQSKIYGTALHCAAIGGRFNIVQLLLDRGANPRAENEQGRTPLHSVSRGKESREHGVRIARLLLERGVDVNAQEKNGWTLLHSAVFNGRLDIAQVLSFFLFV